MPCDTISQFGIELGKNIAPDLLVAALAALELNPQRQENRISWNGGYYDLKTKTATISSSRMRGQQSIEETTKTIKRAYSVEIVKKQAQLNKWQYKTGKNEQGQMTFEVLKQSY